MGVLEAVPIDVSTVAKTAGYSALAALGFVRYDST